jgi:hypothetical protein
MASTPTASAARRTPGAATRSDLRAVCSWLVPPVALQQSLLLLLRGLHQQMHIAGCCIASVLGVPLAAGWLLLGPLTGWQGWQQRQAGQATILVAGNGAPAPRSARTWAAAAAAKMRLDDPGILWNWLACSRLLREQLLALGSGLGCAGLVLGWVSNAVHTLPGVAADRPLPCAVRSGASRQANCCCGYACLLLPQLCLVLPAGSGR